LAGEQYVSSAIQENTGKMIPSHSKPFQAIQDMMLDALDVIYTG
jgi:hypothetical protein